MYHRYKKLTYFFVVVFCFCCDNRTAVEMYKEELINPEFEGHVVSTELWKGGGLTISLEEKKGIIGIINKHNVLNEISKGDFFIKKQNSNKCLIKRKDSVYYFDCLQLIRLKKKTRDSLGEVEQWDRNKINKWMKLNTKQ